MTPLNIINRDLHFLGVRAWLLLGLAFLLGTSFSQEYDVEPPRESEVVPDGPREVIKQTVTNKGDHTVTVRQVVPPEAVTRDKPVADPEQSEGDPSRLANLRVWHRPVLRQIVGRSLIADVIPDSSGFGVRITLYHRDPKTQVSEDYQPIDVSELESFMFFNIEPLAEEDAQDSSGLEDGFPTRFRSVKVTQDTGSVVTTYEFMSGDDQSSAIVKHDGKEVGQSRLTFTDEGSPEQTPSVTRRVWEGGELVSKVEAELDASTSKWEAQQFCDPNCRLTQLRSGDNANNKVTKFNPDSRFPIHIEVTTTDAPTSRYFWTDAGFPVSESHGRWSVSYDTSGDDGVGDLAATFRLDDSAYAKSWVAWSNQGSTVKVVSAPRPVEDDSGNLSPFEKDHPGNASTVVKFDMGNQGGGSIVPWGVVSTSDSGVSGSKISYSRPTVTEENNSGEDETDTKSVEITIQNGRLNAGGTEVTLGTQRTTVVNRFGFTVSDVAKTLPGGNPISGWQSKGSVNDWGAPAVIDPVAPSGLPDASRTFDRAFPVLASTTSSLGVTSEISTRDWAFRPTNFTYDGHAGEFNYLSQKMESGASRIGFEASLNVGNRSKSFQKWSDILGRSTDLTVTGNQTLMRSFSRTGNLLRVTDRN